MFDILACYNLQFGNNNTLQSFYFIDTCSLINKWAQTHTKIEIV